MRSSTLFVPRALLLAAGLAGPGFLAPVLAHAAEPVRVPAEVNRTPAEGDPFAYPEPVTVQHQAPDYTAPVGRGAGPQQDLGAGAASGRFSVSRYHDPSDPGYEPARGDAG